MQHHRTPLAPRLGLTALFTLTPLGCLRSFLAQLVHIHDRKLTLTAAATAPTHRQQQRSTPLTSGLHAAQKPLATFRIASHPDRLRIQLLELAVAFSTGTAIMRSTTPATTAKVLAAPAVSSGLCSRSLIAAHYLLGCTDGSNLSGTLTVRVSRLPTSLHKK